MHVACVIRASSGQCSASVNPDKFWTGCNRPSCELQGTEALGMTVFSFEAFAQLGSERPCPANPPQPEDLCTIMYTSGTTDKPKVSYHTSTSVVRIGSSSLQAAALECAAKGWVQQRQQFQSLCYSAWALNHVPQCTCPSVTRAVSGLDMTISQDAA